MLNETYRGMLAHKSVIRETFMYGKQRAAQIGYENVFDYSLGNPSVPCPEQFTAAMQELQKRVVSEWLPGSGYEWGQAPDLEVYLDDGLSGESSFEVWLPVAKR